MESIEELEKYIEDLAEIKICDMFPKTIQYPRQKELPPFNAQSNPIQSLTNTNNNLTGHFSSNRSNRNNSSNLDKNRLRSESVKSVNSDRSNSKKYKKVGQLYINNAAKSVQGSQKDKRKYQNCTLDGFLVNKKGIIEDKEDDYHGMGENLENDRYNDNYKGDEYLEDNNGFNNFSSTSNNLRSYIDNYNDCDNDFNNDYQNDYQNDYHNEYHNDQAGSNYQIDKNVRTICFSNNEGDDVYDVFIKGDLIIGCGGNFIKIYNKTKLDNNILPYPEFIFSDSEEIFYALSYSEVSMENGSTRSILAVGGKKSIIRILDLNNRCEMHNLIGHRNEIYDLKFCPVKEKSFLLLSASQDFSIRLWHSVNKTQICIFGGLEGHVADVVSIDWHLSTQYFVSSSLDYSVKIWEINDNIENHINLSKSKNQKIKTLIRSIPIFSCNTIHDNYVDCVKFNGNFILSKSVDGVIIEWMPFFNNETDSIFIINTYIFDAHEFVWYMKFDVDVEDKNVLGVGNNKGEFFLFSLNEISKAGRKKDNNINLSDHFFKKPYLGKIPTKDELLIRSVYFDRTSNYFVIGHNSGRISVGMLNPL